MDLLVCLIIRYYILFCYVYIITITNYQLRSIVFRSNMLSFKQKPEQLVASTEPALSSLSSQSPIAARTGRVLRKRTGSPPLVSIFGTYTRRSLLLTFTARARKKKWSSNWAKMTNGTKAIQPHCLMKIREKRCLLFKCVLRMCVCACETCSKLWCIDYAA